MSVFDHGFLYGDGVFEGIRVYEGKIFRLEEHVARLYESARTLELHVPMERTEMIEAITRTVAANDKDDAYVRVVVSRGPGDLGIDPAKCPRATVVIVVDTIAMYPKEAYDFGIDLVTASVRRVPAESLDPRVKSLNYLNNILAKLEAKNAGCLEAIMLNHHGSVAECTGDNLFIVKHGRLETPAVTQGALAGITRGVVLEIAADARDRSPRDGAGPARRLQRRRVLPHRHRRGDRARGLRGRPHHRGRAAGIDDPAGHGRVPARTRRAPCPRPWSGRPTPSCPDGHVRVAGPRMRRPTGVRTAHRHRGAADRHQPFLRTTLSARSRAALPNVS